MNKNIFIKNENKWIATDKGYKKVFASHEKLEKLISDLKRLKIKDAVTLYVPSFNKTLAPLCQF